MRRATVRVVTGWLLAGLAAAALWAFLIAPLRTAPPSGAPSSGAPPAGSAATASPVPAAGPLALQQPETLPVETFEVFLARDPFEPVRPAPGEPSPPPGATPSPGVPPGEGCVGNGEVVCDGMVVSLVDVFVDEDGRPAAVIQVNTTLYTVHEGDVFADNFRVLAIDPPCVTLMFGDDTFTLCEGERILK